MGERLVALTRVDGARILDVVERQVPLEERVGVTGEVDRTALKHTQHGPG